ncbi:MAG TPA: amino acid--[acyl-carrier-protein] ligase [Methylibium sp.]|nr:amino acid--[acyl-carrier-protein] ligase [Methylibium sp.]
MVASLAPAAADHAEAEAFRAGMLARGLLLPMGVPGLFGRGPVFEDVIERFNALVSEVSREDHAEWVHFPPLIGRHLLERVNYLDSFPHLCGSVHSFFGDTLQALALAERAKAGGNWGELLGPTDVVLTPAGCYPVYPWLAGTLPPQGRCVTLLSWVFRHEPSAEPTRLQSFRMREFVRAGRAEQVLEWRERWLQRALGLLGSLGLPAEASVASDPFFGRGGRLLASEQREQKLKFEILVPVISQREPTAVCSFNYHRDHFASIFGIRSTDGESASTSCMGFGMERIAMALFKTHGFEPAQWPPAVRERLWPSVPA